MDRKYYHTMGGRTENRFNVLMIGKTGNGKSSVCNAILGREEFQTGCSMGSTTETVQYANVTVQGTDIRVIDTPDVENSDRTPMERKDEVNKTWRSLASNTPSLVLLAIRCDVRYTAEEYAIYRQMMNYWGNDLLKRRLVVAFTFFDRQRGNIEEELRTVPPELQSVLHDAKNRYVVFDKTNSGRCKNLVHELINMTRSIEDPEKSGARSNTSLSNPVLGLLLAVLAVAVVCVIILAVLKITVGAIVIGVIGLLAAVGIAAYLIFTKGKRTLV